MFNRNGVPQSRLEFLRSLTLFDGVDDKTLSRIDHLLTQTTVQPGKVLTEQGAGSFEAFIVAEGTAEVTINGQIVGSAEPGELIGELGVLEHKSRSATVTAATPMTLLVLNPSELRTLIHEESLADRLQANIARHRGGAQPE